jgi:predicted nucleic acid-binding protein
LGLIEDLGPGPVALDSAVVIYFIEEHPLYLPLIEPVFLAIDQGRIQAVTSSLTLLETIVVPLRAGDLRLADRYEAFLTRSQGLRLVQIDLGLLRSAAHLRAATRLKTPDAIQLATCLAAGCSSLITNDRDYPSMPGTRILQLTEYLDPKA